MVDTITEMLSYPFMVRAFIVGILISLCSALLGVSLVLKRYSMIGDGLSHVGFGALAIAAALNAAPLRVAIPVVIVAAVLLLRVSGSSKIKGDAAIALISTSALAIGIMVISMTTGMNTDVYNYMFGSILAMSSQDVEMSVLLSLVVLVLYIFFYHKIFAITFDETFALATGVCANLYNTLIAVLTAVTIVLGMRMMGTLLISSLIIFPALTSMRVCRTFRTVTINSAVISAVCFCLGIVVSYFLPHLRVPVWWLSIYSYWVYIRRQEHCVTISYIRNHKKISGAVCCCCFLMVLSLSKITSFLLVFMRYSDKKR